MRCKSDSSQKRNVLFYKGASLNIIYIPIPLPLSGLTSHQPDSQGELRGGSSCGASYLGTDHINICADVKSKRLIGKISSQEASSDTSAVPWRLDALESWGERKWWADSRITDLTERGEPWISLSSMQSSPIYDSHFWLELQEKRRAQQVQRGGLSWEWALIKKELCPSVPPDWDHAWAAGGHCSRKASLPGRPES